MKRIDKIEFINAFKEGALMYDIFVVILLIPIGLIQFISNKFILIDFIYVASKSIFLAIIVGGIVGIITKND